MDKTTAKEIGDAIRDALISPNVADSNGEPDWKALAAHYAEWIGCEVGKPVPEDFSWSVA